jgi:hypothetical protein
MLINMIYDIVNLYLSFGGLERTALVVFLIAFGSGFLFVRFCSRKCFLSFI